MVWSTLGTTCGRCHDLVGIPGRSSYGIPCGSPGWKNSAKFNLIAMKWSGAWCCCDSLKSTTSPKLCQKSLVHCSNVTQKFRLNFFQAVQTKMAKTKEKLDVNHGADFTFACMYVRICTVLHALWWNLSVKWRRGKKEGSERTLLIGNQRTCDWIDRPFSPSFFCPPPPPIQQAISSFLPLCLSGSRFYLRFSYFVVGWVGNHRFQTTSLEKHSCCPIRK